MVKSTERLRERKWHGRKKDHIEQSENCGKNQHILITKQTQSKYFIMVAHLRYREIKIRKKMGNRTEIKRVESQTFLMNHFPLPATFALEPFPF